MTKRVVVFASGNACEMPGHSCIRDLLAYPKLIPNVFQITGIVSNHMTGDVQRYASEKDVPFVYYSGPYTATGYQEVMRGECQATYAVLLDWDFPVFGLDPSRTIRISGMTQNNETMILGIFLQRGIRVEFVTDSEQNSDFQSSSLVIGEFPYCNNANQQSWRNFWIPMRILDFICTNRIVLRDNDVVCSDEVWHACIGMMGEVPAGCCCLTA